jgi:serine/threonine protein kinase
MPAIAVEEKMLYCPKCNRRYEDGSQRFCNNDGGRLLPDIVVKSPGGRRRGNAVFTNLLGRTAPRNEKDEKLAETPRFVKIKENKEPQFNPPEKRKVFSEPKATGTEQPLESKPTPLQIPPKESNTEREKNAKPLSRLIHSNEVKIDRAQLGDRRVNPTGRLALSWKNPNILLGQTIKGRYYITEKIDRDQTSIAYLADDKIIHGKRAILRVLMEENSKESLEDKIFAEERISLSHINHPNIARVIDSGELPEGKSFIVTDFIEGTSVKNLLDRKKEFNPLRVARIIRQTSYALSEVHQNGILHRNLKPNQILLGVSEAGIEQVKVKDFGVSSGRNAQTDFVYKSPEQVGGQLPTFASDTYALGVIAFQMLTGRLPFEATSAKQLLKAQKGGLTVKPSDLKSDLPTLVDEVIQKALSFNASDRYPKARDFGDAFYNALMISSPFEEKSPEEPQAEQPEVKKEVAKPLGIPTNFLNEKKNEKSDFSFDALNEEKAEEADIHIASTEVEDEADVVTLEVENKESEEKILPASTDTLWEKRSPEPNREGNRLFTILSVVGLLVLIIGVVWIWRYFNTRGDQPVVPTTAQQTKNAKAKDPTISNVVEENVENVKPVDGIEVPPPEREITEPPNSVFYENSKQNLNKDLAKNFRGFSVYYPEIWKKKVSATNFLDVVKEDENGLPKEQLLITHYKSMGTFEMDKEKFPDLVEKSNRDLERILPNYEMVSQGNITVNNGWKAYEVKFKGKDPEVKGEENVEIWGRRIWMPAARPGVTNGFVITMLATSLSDKINSLDDVGKKGDLGDILYSFEPDRNY